VQLLDTPWKSRLAWVGGAIVALVGIANEVLDLFEKTRDWSDALPAWLPTGLRIGGFAMAGVAILYLARSLRHAQEHFRHAQERMGDLEKLVSPTAWAPERAVTMFVWPVQGSTAILWPSKELDVQVPITFMNRAPFGVCIIHMDLKWRVWDADGDIVERTYNQPTGWGELPGGCDKFSPISGKATWPRNDARLGARVAVTVTGGVFLKGPWEGNKRVEVFGCAFLASQDNRS